MPAISALQHSRVPRLLIVESLDGVATPPPDFPSGRDARLRSDASISFAMSLLSFSLLFPFTSFLPDLCFLFPCCFRFVCFVFFCRSCLLSLGHVIAKSTFHSNTTDATLLIPFAIHWIDFCRHNASHRLINVFQ